MKGHKYGTYYSRGRLCHRYGNNCLERNKMIKLKVTNGKVGHGVGFERIRRITGYLVGTLDRFNDAKRAEVRDRVTHCKGPKDE